MPIFNYKATTPDKKVTTGNLFAVTPEEAAQSLTRQNLSPISIKPTSDITKTTGTIPDVEKITFCRYLSTTLNSGLSLSDGIDVLLTETKTPLLKKILTDLKYNLEQGHSLSEVFSHYPQVFPLYFLSLTKAGEVSGNLANVFKYLETQLHSEYNLKNKIKGALLYPSVVFTAMLGIGFMMFFMVLPQIGKVFLNLRLPLPTLTRTLFTVSILLSRHVLLVISLLVFLTVSAVVLMRKPRVKGFLLRSLSLIPVVKKLIKKIDIARFTRIFSTLLRSAVPITEALEISLETLSWHEFRKLSKVLPEEIRKGKSLSSAIKNHPIFPPLLIQMSATGEKSGSLDSALAEVAVFYEQEVEEELKNITTIIEPVLMLLVGIGVGAMILSIITPIYGVVSSFQSGATPR